MQDLSTVEALHFLRLSRVRQDVVEVVLDPMEVFCERRIHVEPHVGGIMA